MTFLKDCATYEIEKEIFYSDIYKKLGDAKIAIKNKFNNTNYEEQRNKILREPLISRLLQNLFCKKAELLGVP